MATKIRTIDFLPEIFQTTTNELFLNATLDQLVQQPDFKKVQGFIGSKFGYGISSTDKYLTEPTVTRTNYQLEPAVVFKKKDTSIAVDMITYPGLVSAIELESGIKTNHNNLFSNEFYAWDSFADLDKLINFGQYYWVPQGPEPVTISNVQALTEATFAVNSLANEYTFVINDASTTQGNPTIELVRGGTYRFNLNQTTPFYIQTQPGLSGVDATKTNVSTREIYGVENNGSQTQSVIFNVPLTSDQQYIFSPGDIFADLLTTKSFNDIHHHYLNEIVSIDGVNQLEGKTLLFYGTDAAEVSNFTNTNVNKYLYKIRYLGNSSNPLIELDPYEILSDNTQITIQSGVDYISRVFIKDSYGNIQLIPQITSTLDTLYYQDGVNPSKFGKIKLIDNPLSSTINVNDDVLGQTSYTSPNGITFTNGLKVQFTGSIFPVEFLNDTYYVEGVGTGIILIPVSQQIVPEPFGDTISEAFDETYYDMDTYESSLQLSHTADYITINRASLDRNAWTRSNAWFHVDVLKITIENNTISPIASAALASNNARAKRPIIEFYPNLKLINSGVKGRTAIDYVDLSTNNAMSIVSGATAYYPDGVTSQLFNGARIVFANDNNVEVRNKIFVANISKINGVETITLSVASDGNIKYLDQVFVTRGEKYKGTSYYFDGAFWIQAQQKTTVNQAPLFDIFDSNGISFSDTSYYAGSDFIGCTLFQYAIGTGPVDTILNFPIAYGNVGNLSDITFEITLNNQIFNYVINNVSTPQSVNTGYVYSLDNNGNTIRKIGWVTAAEKSFQYQVFNYVYNSNVMPAGPIFITDIAAKSSTSTIWPTIVVYVDNTRVDTSSYTVSIGATTTTIILLNSIAEDTHVDVMIYSDQISEMGYFQVPSNLDHNPFNTPITNLNLGDIRGHYKSICNNIALSGSAFGANNYRDMGIVIPYGTKIIQNSSSIASAAAFLRKQSTNFFNSIIYNSTEYVKFKALLANTVNTQNFTPYDTPDSMLDSALDIITSVKSSDNAFYWSDMLPSKTPKYVNNYQFKVGIANSVFPTNILHDFKNANYNGLLIYVVRNVAGLPTQTIQLYKDIDYVVPDGQLYVEILLTLQNNDVIIIKEYDQTYGSYIPNTPTKVGFYPLFVPEVILDDTYTIPTYFLKGHDGSYTKLYGEYNNGYLEDFRDKVLYEFEMRIYNNMKVDAKLPLSLDDIKPGQFRTTDYSYNDFMTIYSTSFLNWIGLNRVNYTNQFFDSNNDFTWNYNSTLNNLDNTKFKQGNWKGIYLWLYDTVSPHTTPWEMLGLVNKPVWWETRYGPAPYTSDNTLLWTDLSNGYVYNDGSPYINSKRVRPNLVSIIPVDNQGNLLSPFGQYTNGQLISTYNNATFNAPWAVGDVGPAEYSYLKSSAWPFDLMRIYALTKPAQFFTLGLDLDVYKYSTEFQQYLVYDRLRTAPNQLEIYGGGAGGPVSAYSNYAQHSYFNWVVDYLNQYGLNGSSIITDLSNSLDVRLVYRLAGFSDKNQLEFYIEKGSPNSKNNVLLIPDDSYNIVLYKNEPDDVIIYSSIIIQKISTGYKIFGNSQNKAYFLAFDPLFNNNYTPITVGGTSVNVPNDYASNVTVIPYGYEFSSIQLLANFIASYGRYLTSQGMQFTDTENGIEINWNQMIAEMLYWYNTGWEVGSTINLNPNANIITIDNSQSVIQPLTDYNENYILNQNLIQVPINNLEIYRKDTLFSAKALTQGDSLSYFRSIVSSVEHAVIFDNTTVFNDIIFNLVTGLRQQRLYLKGTKTNNWNGTLNAPGFIINQDNVTDWQPNVRYVKGDIVVYKRQYWMANIPVVVPNITFNSNEWLLTQYQNIHKGLVPNPSTRSYESDLYYNTYKSNLESDGGLLSYSLIGYRPRPYLADANLDDTSQVNLFKTMIKGKGTGDTLKALQSIELQGHEFTYDIYENWAIKSVEYGGVLNSNFIEFTLNGNALTGNPSIIAITNGNGVSYAQQEIPLSNIVNYARSLISSDILPIMTTAPMTQLASAGYVHMDDVALMAYTVQRLDPLSVYFLYGDDYVWIANKTNDWGVYSVLSLNNSITSIKNNFNNTVTVTFESAHNLTTSDVIGISYYSTVVDGYYTINSIASATSIIINISLPNGTTSIPAVGSSFVIKLQLQRIGSPLDINSLPLAYEYANEYVWMDKGSNNNWLVYEKSQNYSKTNFISSIENDVNVSYGSQVIYIPEVGFYISDAGRGIMYKYIQSDAGFVKMSEYTPDGGATAPYGQVIARSDEFVAVSSPNPSISQIFIYRIVNTPEIDALVLEQVLNYTFGVPVGTAMAFSGDSEFFFVNFPGLNLTSAGGGQGAILIYKRSPDFTYFNPYPTMALSNTTLPNEKFFTLRGDRRSSSALVPGQRISFFHYTQFGASALAEVGYDPQTGYTLQQAETATQINGEAPYKQKYRRYYIKASGNIPVGTIFAIDPSIDNVDYTVTSTNSLYDAPSNTTKIYLDNILAPIWTNLFSVLDTYSIQYFDLSIVPGVNQIYTYTNMLPVNTYVTVITTEYTPDPGFPGDATRGVTKVHTVERIGYSIPGQDTYIRAVQNIFTGGNYISTPLSTNAADVFGYSIAVNYDATKLFVGAPYKNFLSPFIANVGTVYAFSRLEQKYEIDFTPPAGNVFELYLDFIPGVGTSLWLNGSKLDTSRYAFGSINDSVYVKISGLVAGDIISIKSPNFVVDQQLTSYESPDGVIPGQQFGKSISCNSTGTEVIVGCPHDLTMPGQEGAVYRFTHEGKKYGTITALIGVNGTGQMTESYILLNGYSVQIPVGDAYTAANAINNAAVPNVIAYVFDTPSGDNLLRIRLLNKSIGEENNKLDINVFNGNEFFFLGIAPYIKTQVIREPHAQEGSYFGEHVLFNEKGSFAVTAPHATSYASTSFDNLASDIHNNTVFDNNLTTFEDKFPEAGAVYIFDYIPTYDESLLNAGQFVYAQSCNDDISDYGATPLYGASIAFNNDTLMVGSPKFKADIAVSTSTYTGDGTTKSYSIYSGLSSNDIQVTLNGIVQRISNPAKTYINDGKTLKYTLTAGATQNSLFVTVNGVLQVAGSPSLPGSNYIVNTTSLTFINRLNPGDVVSITELYTGAYHIVGSLLVFNVAPVKNAIIQINQSLHKDNLGYSSANGRVTIYENKSKINNWHIYRNPTEIVDLDKIQQIKLYDNVNDDTLDSLDYFDPLNGKLLGAVRENLDFISDSDPAGYNSPKYTTGKLVWGTNHVGKLWFNTSNTKFLNYHQDDLHYNSVNWGRIFPGSTVTVYSWTENSVLPVNYTGAGTVLDIEKYVVGYSVDSTSQLVTKYYYWVRNTNEIYNGKTLSDSILENYITDPQNSGISYFAPLDASTYALYNSRDYIHGVQTNMHIGFSTGVSEAPLRNEFKLIRSNFAEDFLPGFVDPSRGYTTPIGLYSRMLDSFAGDDLSGQVVPDLNLPSYMRTGVNVRPRQSFFVDRFNALKNYLEYCNTVLLQYPVTEVSNLTFLSAQGTYYDTTAYWSYVYYWDTGYSDSTKTTVEVNIYADLLKLTPSEGMIVGVRFNGQGKREVYAYTSGQWNRVGLQDGTIQINSMLWDYAGNRIGFGDSFFDTLPFDQYPSTETRYIIRALNEQIFTGPLLKYRNESLILLFEYIQSENTLEHNYLPWLNKTSFVDIDYVVRPLIQETKYQLDNSTLLSGYVDEIKPYHTVVKDISFSYTGYDSTESYMTDFDLPAIYDATRNVFTTPKLVYDSNATLSNDDEYSASASIWTTDAYSSWYQNFGLTLIDIPNQTVASVTKYVATVDNILYIDNARGLPIQGVMYINGEAIGYNNINRETGLVSGLTRGLENTTVITHLPGELVVMNLPAIMVLDGGRNYVNPPSVTAYIDTTIYPKPTTPAVLSPVMNGDQVAAVVVVDPGAGYAVKPEIIFSSSYDVTFDENAINATTHTILIPSTFFVTGDLIKSTSSDPTHTSILDGYYYVYIVATINENELAQITLHKSHAASLKGENQLVFAGIENASTTYTFSLTARAIPQTTNTLVRTIQNTMRFDRTSYAPKVQQWVPSQYYSSPFNSLGTEISQSTLLSYSQPYTNLSGTGGNGTGAVFTVYNVFIGGNYSVTVTNSGNHYHINDTITITGSHLGGTDSINDCVITVTGLLNTYTRLNADVYTGTSGTAALFTIVSNGINYAVTVASPGINYVLGDQFTFAGGRFNGVSTTNDVTITVTGITSQGAITTISFSGTPATNGSIHTLSVSGTAVDAYLSSLAGVVLPITNSYADGNGNSIVSLDYALSGLKPGQIQGSKVYFYRNLNSYIYDDTNSNFTGNIVGSISGTTLTVTTVNSGNLGIPYLLHNGGVVSGTYVTAQLTATETPVATATAAQATVGTNTLLLSSFTLNDISRVLVGQFVQPVTGIPANTFVTFVNYVTGSIIISNNTTAVVNSSLNIYIAGGTGTYTVNNNQSLASTTMDVGGGAKIEIHRPRFNPNSVNNEYFIKILNYGTCYNDTTQNKIVVSGALLGGIAGVNDATITVHTGSLIGNNPIISATVGGIAVGFYEIYYLNPIDDTHVQVFKDSARRIPLPYNQYVYTDYSNITNRTASNYIGSLNTDYAYIPEPIYSGEGYVYDATALVLYNGSAYTCIQSNNDSVFDPAKWTKLQADDRKLNALDRIVIYYQPSATMIPKDIQQLVKGTSYPNDVYYGNSFSPEDSYPIDMVVKDQIFYPRDVSIKAMIYDGENYVALSESSTHSSVLTSTDGINWNNFSISNSVLQLTSLNYNTDHQQYVVTDNTYHNSLLLSHDLENWLGVGQSTNYGMTPYDDNNFDSSPIVCPDGILNKVIYTQGYYYAAGDKILKSIDGVIWETVALLTGQYPAIINDMENVITTYFDGFIAVGETTASDSNHLSQTVSYIMASIDGNNWMVTDNQFLGIGSVHLVTYSPDIIVIAGASGSVFYSTNGFNWLMGDISGNGNTNALNKGAYANGIFILVGDSGVILRSTNGIDWLDVSGATTNNLYSIINDGVYFYAAGDKGTILQSMDGTTWLDTSVIRQPTSDVDPIEKLPYSTIKGSDFLFGYGPEEMIPGLMTDSLSMTVVSAPGSYWDDTNAISGQLIVENNGFSMISKTTTPIKNKVSFASMALYPAQISVFVMDMITHTGTRIYEQSSANSPLSYTVDWYNKEITLSDSLTNDNQITIEVYEIGNGKEYFKSSTDYVPLRTNDQGNSYIQLDIKYKPIQVEPVIYVNGSALVYNQDYTIDFTTGVYAYTIITFVTEYDQETDYITFTLLDTSLNDYNTTEYLFSIPETQLFTGSSTDTFNLTNYIGGTYSQPPGAALGDNATNAIVEINGIRRDPTPGVEYTITVPDPVNRPNVATLVFNNPVSSDDLVAVTTYHEVQRLYLKTLVWTSAPYTVQDLFYYGIIDLVEYSDPTKVWVTINGQRVDPSVVTYDGANLNIATTINSGDEVVATIMAKGSSPNALSYTVDIDKNNNTLIYRNNIEITSWLVTDLLPSDSSIYVYDLQNIIDKGTTQGIVKINNEKIRYSMVDLVANTLSGLTRGVLGTSVAEVHSMYEQVTGLTANATLDPNYYNKRWNTNNIDEVNGDPLQLSTSPTATFLKYGHY